MAKRDERRSDQLVLGDGTDVQLVYDASLGGEATLTYSREGQVAGTVSVAWEWLVGVARAAYFDVLRHALVSTAEQFMQKLGTESPEEMESVL